jgi:hypothetical protein
MPLPPSVMERAQRGRYAPPASPEAKPKDKAARADTHRKAAEREARKQYCLLDVGHDIRMTDLNVFTTQGHTLVQVIEKTGEMTLRMSGWEMDGEVVHIYNYWHLRTGPMSLIRAELSLPDNPVFVRFDRYMLSETKELVTPFSRNLGIPITQEDRDAIATRGQRYVYARVTYKVRPSDWAEMLARFEASLRLFGRSNGWRLGDVFLGLTGDASTVIQTWAVPDISAHLAEQRLAAAPWAPLLLSPPVCQILEPTPSCPLLGTRAKKPNDVLAERKPGPAKKKVTADVSKVPASKQAAE